MPHPGLRRGHHGNGNDLVSALKWIDRTAFSQSVRECRGAALAAAQGPPPLVQLRAVR